MTSFPEMEQAYDELYQQFLCLRSLCLRQAALLHKLTAALQEQQGATVCNGELGDMVSIPVQCTQGIPAYFQEIPRSQASTAHTPAKQCGTDLLSRNLLTLSDQLTVDISKLSVDGLCQRQENWELARNAESQQTLNSLKKQGATSKLPKNLLQAAHRSGDTMFNAMGMPVSDSPSPVTPSQSDGLLMSDVALQSHVCEFCQAVFPGDTTTRGEFLRHLCTHVA